MQCFVYRSKRKQHTYLFLAKQGDFSDVPESLLALFGDAEYSFNFKLVPEKKLVLADAQEVLRNINENGFFLQLPPGDKVVESFH